MSRIRSLPRPPEIIRRYDIRGGNRTSINSLSPEVLNCGPRGTGKSVAMLYKCFLIAEKIDGARILIMRKTRSSLTDSAMVTLEKHVIPGGHPVLAGPRRMNRHSYLFGNGSEIVFGGMGSAEESKKIMSTEWDIIYVNEAVELREDEWEQLIPTLRNNRRTPNQLIADCNPDAPTHWLKRRCDLGATELHTSAHQDNPWLFSNGEWTRQGQIYMGALDRLTGVRRERFLFGRWSQAEGAVYESYDPRVHLIDRFEIPKEWRRIRAIDFGYTNPFVCLWIAVDGDGRAYVYRQLYHTKRIVEDHAKQIVRLSEGEVISATIADHDAEDRATLARYGVSTYPADRRDKRARIELVEQALRAAGDGRPRLFILRDSLIERDDLLDEHKLPWCLEQEFPAYCWPGRKAPDKNSKELPVDRDDHALDALNYGITYLHGGGGPVRVSRGPERPSAGMRDM